MSLLRTRGVDIIVVACRDANESFIADMKKRGLSTYAVPYRTVSGFPDMDVEKRFIEWADVVWISDIEYLVARRVKKTRKDVPVIAHIHSPWLICPVRTAFFGHQNTCTIRCSWRRIITCKRLSKKYLAHWGVHGKFKMRIYELLNFGKGPIDLMLWPMKDAAAGSIDGFVTVSRAMRDIVHAHLPQPEGTPIEVVYNSVMVPETAADRQGREVDKTILYASGADVFKGPHVVLHAFRKLLDNGGGEFKLIMLGVKGDHWIEALVRRLRLEDHAELLCRVNRNELCRRIANSNIVVMPTLAPETFGRIPAEANLLGTPAVVSNRGALPEIIVDNVTGLVTEPSVDALAGAMERALTKNWNRELIVRTAKERFDPDCIADDFLRLLHASASKHP